MESGQRVCHRSRTRRLLRSLALECAGRYDHLSRRDNISAICHHLYDLVSLPGNSVMLFSLFAPPPHHIPKPFRSFLRDLVGFLCHSRCPSEVDIGFYLSLVLRTSTPGFISHSSLRLLLGLLLLPTFLHSLNVRSLFPCLLHLPRFILDIPSVNPVIQELSCLHVISISESTDDHIKL